MKNAQMVRTKTRSSALVTDGVGTDIMQGAAVGLAAMAAGLVGAWSISCLVAGVIAVGGPIALVTSWFGAVTGM